MVKRGPKRRSSEQNDALITALLERSPKALSAYDIIDALHADGISSPPTVYRSLARLVEKGVVHRVESLNAFVACNGHRHDQRFEALFAICRNCGKITEFSDSHVVDGVQTWAQAHGFRIDHVALELRGTCQKCANAIAGTATGD